MSSTKEEFLDDAYAALAEAEGLLRTSAQLDGWDRDDLLEEVETQLDLVLFFLQKVADELFGRDVQEITRDPRLELEAQVDAALDVADTFCRSMAYEANSDD